MLETVGCYVAEKLQSTGRVVQSDLWIGLKEISLDGWMIKWQHNGSKIRPELTFPLTHTMPL
jgi:hypothetical protein